MNERITVSHVATIEIEITDLADLRAACAEMGLVFEEGQQDYNCFHADESPQEISDFWEEIEKVAREDGETPFDGKTLEQQLASLMPPGFELEDVGHCQHAIRLNDGDKRNAFHRHKNVAYEIGVVRRRDGKPGWMLLWDDFYGGFGLSEKIGEGAGRLKQAVATAASIRTMTSQGYRCQRQQLPNGSVQLVFQKG